jgi:hypothetical protein
VLVQSMRQDAFVSGSVIVEIEGVQGNKALQLPLAKAVSDAQADTQLPFRFRYFQNIEQDIVLPAGFEPRAVTVEVKTAKLAPVRESYPWQVQVES